MKKTAIIMVMLGLVGIAQAGGLKLKLKPQLTGAKMAEDGSISVECAILSIGDVTASYVVETDGMTPWGSAEMPLSNPQSTRYGFAAASPDDGWLSAVFKAPIRHVVKNKVGYGCALLGAVGYAAAKEENWLGLGDEKKEESKPETPTTITAENVVIGDGNSLAQGKGEGSTTSGNTTVPPKEPK